MTDWDHLSAFAVSIACALERSPAAERLLDDERGGSARRSPAMRIMAFG
jgi:hypothetical protein